MPFAYRYLLAVVYLSPWFTQSIVMMTGVQIYTLAVAAFGIYQLDQCAANLWLGISFERGARLRWQSQPRRLGRLTRLRGFRAGDNYGQVLAGIEIDWSVSDCHHHSTGTTNSLLRTMFNRARAAISIALGSVRNRCSSVFKD